MFYFVELLRRICDLSCGIGHYFDRRIASDIVDTDYAKLVQDLARHMFGGSGLALPFDAQGIVLVALGIRRWSVVNLMLIFTGRPLTNGAVLIDYPIMVSHAKLVLILAPWCDMDLLSEYELAVGLLSILHGPCYPWRFRERPSQVNGRLRLWAAIRDRVPEDRARRRHI